MPAPRPGLSHVNFRVPADIHRQLLRIADGLSLDLTGVLNLMLKEALPTYLDKVARLEEHQDRAERALDRAELARHRLTRKLVEEGRELPTAKRLNALVKAAIRLRDAEDDPPVVDVVRCALAELREQDEVRDLEAVYERLKGGSGDV